MNPKLKRCLLGLAVGDALGVPLEGCFRKTVIEKLPFLELLVEADEQVDRWCSDTFAQQHMADNQTGKYHELCLGRLRSSMLAVLYHSCSGEAPFSALPREVVMKIIGVLWEDPDNVEDVWPVSLSSLMPTFQRTRRLPSGSYSDDTQMALVTLYSVFHQCQLADVIVPMRRSLGKSWPRHSGKSLRKTIAAMMNGVSRVSVCSCGNGAAMRLGPLGALEIPSKQFLRVVLESALQTHSDVRAVSAAVAVAAATRFYCMLSEKHSDSNSELVRPKFVAYVYQCCRDAEVLAMSKHRDMLEYPARSRSKESRQKDRNQRRGEHAFSSAVRKVLKRASAHLSDTSAMIVSSAQKHTSVNVQHAGQGFAFASVLLSVSLAMHARSFEHAMAMGLSCGSPDVDTVLAMLGCIVGAKFPAIPAVWLQGLANVHQLRQFDESTTIEQLIAMEEQPDASGRDAD